MLNNFARFPAVWHVLIEQLEADGYEVKEDESLLAASVQVLQVKSNDAVLINIQIVGYGPDGKVVVAKIGSRFSRHTFTGGERTSQAIQKVRDLIAEEEHTHTNHQLLQVTASKLMAITPKQAASMPHDKVLDAVEAILPLLSRKEVDPE